MGFEGKYKVQKTIDNKEDLLEAIHRSNSVKTLNKLREAVVKTKNMSLLKMWQEKYWKFKK